MAKEASSQLLIGKLYQTKSDCRVSSASEPLKRRYCSRGTERASLCVCVSEFGRLSICWRGCTYFDNVAVKQSEAWVV